MPPTWGFGIYESAAPNAANSIGNAFANYNQNTQGLMQMDENRRARKEQEEQRKKAEKKQRQQFWTNLGIGVGVGALTGGALAAATGPAAGAGGAAATTAAGETAAASAPVFAGTGAGAGGATVPIAAPTVAASGASGALSGAPTMAPVFGGAGAGAGGAAAPIAPIAAAAPAASGSGTSIGMGALLGGAMGGLSQLPGGAIPANAIATASPVFNPQIGFNQQRLDLLNRKQALDESMFPTEQAYKQSVATRNFAYPGIEAGKLGIAGREATTREGRLALDQMIDSPQNVAARLSNERTRADASMLGSEASMLGAQTRQETEGRHQMMFPTEQELKESQITANNARALSLGDPRRGDNIQSQTDLNRARTADLQGKSQKGGDQRQAVASHIAASVYPQGHPQQGMIRPESMDQVIALFHGAPSEIKHDPNLIISLMNRGIPPRRIMDKSDPQMVQIIEMLIKSKQ